MRPIVTLTTDFGLSDTYVGAMKGAVLRECPDAALVDITHAIPPGDVLRAALALEECFAAFPAGTVHLAVVDPGVGSSRGALAVRTERYRWTGPDNGVLSLALAHEQAVSAVTLSEGVRGAPSSATFHGRDVFAPAAGCLARGVDVAALGVPVAAWQQVAPPEVADDAEGLCLTVLWVDRFGNAVTNLTRRDWNRRRPRGPWHVRAGSATIPAICRTYSDVPTGTALAYFGSGGRLEVGVRDGSAADSLHLGRGSHVWIIRAAP